MHPAHPQTRFPTADAPLHLQTASVSLSVEQRHRLTFEKGLETRRGGCKEILGEAAEVPSPVKSHGISAIRCSSGPGAPEHSEQLCWAKPHGML